MDNKLASARFVRLFAISFVLLCIVAGTFNALVDPYGIFGSPRIPGFNALKPRAAERVRVAKPYMAEAFKARTVIGGLATSTLITLVFIPVVYYTLEGWKRRPLAAPAGEALDVPAPSGD